MATTEEGQASRAAQWAAALGRQVREKRRALGLSQLELADLSGCGTAFLYQLEHGKPSVRMDKVVEVLAVLGMELTLQHGGGGGAARDEEAP